MSTAKSAKPAASRNGCSEQRDACPLPTWYLSRTARGQFWVSLVIWAGRIAHGAVHLSGHDTTSIFPPRSVSLPRNPFHGFRAF